MKKRIFELTTILKKMGQYELAHFLIGQYAASHMAYAPDGLELTVLTDENLGHELLEVRDVEMGIAQVISLEDVNPTWLYYHMAYGHIKSDDRKGRSWGVPVVESEINREELKEVLNSLWPQGINRRAPVELPAGAPDIQENNNCWEILRKTVDYFLDNPNLCS